MTYNPHTWTRPPQIRLALDDELVVDNFAGGGGASIGIEQGIGRPVDIAINHDAKALATHMANHPETRHYCEDVFKVDPREVCQGRPVGLAWFSPDCTHHSKARFGLVTVAGQDYQIIDIGMRMLQPRELYRAQGFPDSYVIDPLIHGKRLTKTDQVRQVGNSVSPPMARALVAANISDNQAQMSNELP